MSQSTFCTTVNNYCPDVLTSFTMAFAGPVAAAGAYFDWHPQPQTTVERAIGVGLSISVAAVGGMCFALQVIDNCTIGDRVSVDEETLPSAESNSLVEDLVSVSGETPSIESNYTQIA